MLLDFAPPALTSRRGSDLGDDGPAHCHHGGSGLTTTTPAARNLRRMLEDGSIEPSSRRLPMVPECSLRVRAMRASIGMTAHATPTMPDPHRREAGGADQSSHTPDDVPQMRNLIVAFHLVTTGGRSFSAGRG